MKFSIYGIISRIPAGMIQAAFLSAAFIVAGNSESAAQSAGVEGILEVMEMLCILIVLVVTQIKICHNPLNSMHT